MAENDTAEWLAAWRLRAEDGDPDAQIVVGWEYFKGELVTRDVVHARRWFMAAEAERPDWGYFNLVKMLILLNDDSVSEVFSTKVWDTGAIYYLYEIHLRKNGGDNAELLQLLQSGAERGHLPSLVKLHQHGRSRWERFVAFPREALLLLRLLVVWWRDPSDERVAH